MLRSGIEMTNCAYDTVSEEQICSNLVTPQGSTPFNFFLELPAVHLYLHTGQIDFLQTCWVDQEIYLE